MGGALLTASALLGAAHIIFGVRALLAAEVALLALYGGWWLAAWLRRVLRAPLCASLLGALALPAGQAALVRLAYPHLTLPPQLDEVTSDVQRWPRARSACSPMRMRPGCSPCMYVHP